MKSPELYGKKGVRRKAGKIRSDGGYGQLDATIETSIGTVTSDGQASQLWSEINPTVISNRKYCLQLYIEAKVVSKEPTSFGQITYSLA